MTAIPEPANNTAWFDTGSCMLDRDNYKGVVLVRADDAKPSDGEARWYEVANSKVLRRFLGHGITRDAGKPACWHNERGPFVYGPLEPAPAEFVHWVLDQLGRKP